MIAVTILEGKLLPPELFCLRVLLELLSLIFPQGLKLLPLLCRQPRFHLFVRLEHNLLESGKFFLSRITRVSAYFIQQICLLLRDGLELGLLVWVKPSLLVRFSILVVK